MLIWGLHYIIPGKPNHQPPNRGESIASWQWSEIVLVTECCLKAFTIGPPRHLSQRGGQLCDVWGDNAIKKKRQHLQREGLIPLRVQRGADGFGFLLAFILGIRDEFQLHVRI